MKYQLVQLIEEVGWVTSVFTEENLQAAMEVRGYKVEGMQAQYKGGTQLREQLVGQPKFSGVAGPMWGGIGPDGEPIIRYENWPAYERLSA